MPATRVHRISPLAGVVFALLSVTGVALTRGEPDDGAAASTIFRYWHDHRGVELISSLLCIPLAIVCLLVLADALSRTVGSQLVSAGALVAAAGLTTTAGLSAAVATVAHHGAHEATYTLAELQSYAWVLWMPGFALMLLASGIAGLRSATLPRPLALPTVLLGVACLTPAGIVAFFVLPVWAIAASVVLYRRIPVAARVGAATAQPV